MIEDPVENEVNNLIMEDNIEDDTDIVIAIAPTDEWA